MTFDELKMCSVYRQSIRSIEDSIERLRSDMERVTQVLSHAPAHTGNQDKLAEQVRFMVELEAARAAKVVEMENHIDKCRVWLSTIPSQQAAVLTCRYIDGMKWAEVARKTGYSKHHCYKIRDAALKKLKVDTQ